MFSDTKCLTPSKMLPALEEKRRWVEEKINLYPPRRALIGEFKLFRLGQ